MPAKPTVVYPIPGFFIEGVPAVPTECPTKAQAQELVDTGAFSYERTADVEAEPVPLADDSVDAIAAAAGEEPESSDAAASSGEEA